MAGPYGILGTIVFIGGLGTANGPREISKNDKSDFVRHKIFNGVDLIESVGDEPIDLDMQIKFIAGYTSDPSASLIALQALKAAKTPVPLMIGATPFGRGLLTLFVIESIQSKFDKWVAGSTLGILNVSLKLVEYYNPFSLSGPLGPLVQAGLALLSGGSSSVVAVAGTLGAAALGSIPSPTSILQPGSGVLGIVGATAF